ncbi:hypothetical protein RQP46_003958 [Phenoliferia psychrophenolica]
MHAFTVISLLATASSFAVAAPSRASRMAARQGSVLCDPKIPANTTVIISSVLNSTLNLGTDDCEACTNLGLYTGSSITNEFNAIPGPVPSNTSGYYTFETPNYYNECLTRTEEGSFSPFVRAPCVAQSLSQVFFTFQCEECPVNGTDGVWGKTCNIQYTNITTYDDPCLKSSGQPNVGGLSMEQCVYGSPAFQWNVNIPSA